MLGAVEIGLAEIATREQVLVHTYRTLVFAAAAKQITQSEVQLGGVGVVLYGFNESVNCLVLLLVEQVVQAFEVSAWGLAVFKTQLA